VYLSSASTSYPGVELPEALVTLADPGKAASLRVFTALPLNDGSKNNLMDKELLQLVKQPQCLSGFHRASKFIWATLL
jgi:hypothetical protein